MADSTLPTPKCDHFLFLCHANVDDVWSWAKLICQANKLQKLWPCVRQREHTGNLSISSLPTWTWKHHALLSNQAGPGPPLYAKICTWPSTSVTIINWVTQILSQNDLNFFVSEAALSSTVHVEKLAHCCIGHILSLLLHILISRDHWDERPMGTEVKLWSVNTTLTHT